MKKTLLALAAIALLYTGCKKEETIKDVVKIEASGLKYAIAVKGAYNENNIFLDKADQTGANTYMVSVDSKVNFNCLNYYSSSVTYKVYVNGVLKLDEELSPGTTIEFVPIN